MEEILSNDAVRLALLLLLFVAIIAVTLGLAGMFGERREVQERLGSGGNASADDDMVAPGAGLRVHDARGAWVSLVTAIEKAGVPLVDTKDATLRSRMISAGYSQEHAPRVYSLVRLVMVIGLPVGILSLLWAS